MQFYKSEIQERKFLPYGQAQYPLFEDTYGRGSIQTTFQLVGLF